MVAPVSSSHELDPPAARRVVGASDVLADDSKLDGTFRRIRVRFDGDPEDARARVQYIMHDTGAGCSLTFEGTLFKLGLDFERISYDNDLISVTGARFRPIGKRQICFSYFDRPKTKHWTDIIVLPDPADGLKPAFDLLFGRDTIRKVKAITWDLEVIGVNFVHTSALATTFPSLRSASPRPSLISNASREDEQPSQVGRRGT